MSSAIMMLYALFKHPHLLFQVHRVSFIRLLVGSLVVMEWQTFSGSTHLAKCCADSSSECPFTFIISASGCR